jgi:hypothetical protein
MTIQLLFVLFWKLSLTSVIIIIISIPHEGNTYFSRDAVCRRNGQALKYSATWPLSEILVHHRLLLISL